MVEEGRSDWQLGKIKTGKQKGESKGRESKWQNRDREQRGGKGSRLR